MSDPRPADLDKRIMTVIWECTAVHTATEFSTVIEGSFCDVLPHESMLCGIGGVSRPA